MSSTGLLNADWLYSTTSGGQQSINCCVNHHGGPCTCWGYNGYQSSTYPWYWSYNVVNHPPIKLKMSEVETLRAATRGNAELKKILNKFTSQIEVEVDF